MTYDSPRQMAAGRVYFYESVTSTLDKSFELIARGNLDVWDSVLAASQTNGRGQMRRYWASPAGNLHASLRLPFSSPFNTCGAAVATSTLCMLALKHVGVDVRIKWPNDLVILKDGDALKAGGILLEEHSYSLVAGIGLNIKVVPDISRENGDLPVTRVMDCMMTEEEWEVEELWKSIVKNMIRVYNSSLFSSDWTRIAQDGMVWLDQPVRLVDGDVIQSGILSGLGTDGSLKLGSASGNQYFCHGTLELDE